MGKRTKKSQATPLSAEVTTGQVVVQPSTVDAAIAEFEALAPVAAEVSTNDALEASLPRSVVPGRFKTKYAATGGHCGDDIAALLKAFTFSKDADGRDSIDLTKLAQVAAANDVDFGKYDGLNNGMKRMNVSNKLRGMHRHGKDVVIGTDRVAGAKPPSKQVEAGEAKQAAA